MKINRNTIKSIFRSDYSGLSAESTGFTLIELLVVIAIISILATILIPSLSMAKDLAQKAACTSNLRSTQVGMALYGNDHMEHLPTITEHKSYADLSPYPNSLALLYPEYIEAKGIFKCPGAKEEDEETITLSSGEDFAVSYYYQDSAQSVSLSRQGLRTGQDYEDMSGWMGIPIMSCRTSTAAFPFSGTITRMNHGMSGGLTFGQTNMNFLMLQKGQLVIENMVAEDRLGDGILNQNDLLPSYFVNVLRGWRGWNYAAAREWR